MRKRPAPKSPKLPKSRKLLGDGSAPPLKFRHFRVSIDVEIDVSISESLLNDVLDSAWQREFYELPNSVAVAGNLAFNLLQGRALRSLDGFADQPGGAVRVSLPLTEDQCDIEVRELVVDGTAA